eukprot:SAG31_NODE_11398_length_1035_cov_1.198718_1_plen_73_part_00
MDYGTSGIAAYLIVLVVLNLNLVGTYHIILKIDWPAIIITSKYCKDGVPVPVPVPKLPKFKFRILKINNYDI